MAKKALFSGLVFDEFDKPVDTTYVGDEPCYVVDDDGFLRHIPSEQVDRQVLNYIIEFIKQNQDVISEQAARMLGQEDIFSLAMIKSQIENLDKQINNLFEVGLAEEMRAYMGMTGFKITINLHGDVLDVQQPGMIDGQDE